MKKQIRLPLRFGLVVLLGAAFYVIVGCGGGTSEIPLPEDDRKGIGGSMAFDGNHFWCMRIPRSLTGQGEREIVCFDKTGQVMCTYTPDENFTELAFDGEHIWTTDAFGSSLASIEFNGNFYIVDSETGVLKKRFRIYADYMTDALAASSGRLWLYANLTGHEARDKLILEIDTDAGEITNVIDYPEDISSTCSGMTYADGHLWLATGLIKHEIVKMDPRTGEIVKKYDFTGRIINGITTDGENIYLADGEKHVLLVLEK